MLKIKELTKRYGEKLAVNNINFSVEPGEIFGFLGPNGAGKTVAGLPLFIIGVFIDLKRPMLKWDNPQQPVKQNMNVLISMGMGVAYATVLYLLYQFVFSLFLPVYMMFVLLLLIGMVLTYVTYHILEKQFNESLIVMD